jgi:anti-anti-sigma factor
MTLQVSLKEDRPNVFSAKLKGSLDTSNYLDLEDRLKEVIDDDTRAVVLDMGDVNYVSSAGIRTVMWARKTLTAQNANFSMINLQPTIKKIFNTMKLLPILDIFDDMPQADKFIDQIINEELARRQK